MVIPQEPSYGILVVGLFGSNGSTLACASESQAQQIISFRGPQGQRRSPSLNGCITQMDFSDVETAAFPFRGFRHMLGDDEDFAKLDFGNCAVGGWDVRNFSSVGEALEANEVLDYDLVRQVREGGLDDMMAMKGVYDRRFISEAMHEEIEGTVGGDFGETTTAHSLPHCIDLSSVSPLVALAKIRGDIQKWRKSKFGESSSQHITVVWSGTVEPNSPHILKITTAEELLGGNLGFGLQFSKSDDDGSILLDSVISSSQGGRNLAPSQFEDSIPPSLIYATAAILEGCSFVNGASHNTLACRGLHDLNQRLKSPSARGYLLGTDFKAGQTKFKTAAVEYLRNNGLRPEVVASANHLGNNDMRSLAGTSGQRARSAKLRVKHSIFENYGYVPPIDHKVSVMFTPQINDEKRDYVEYTSSGFLGQAHTMVTYTRASDSVLCVPLYIDAAVFCTYFRSKRVSQRGVSKGLAYLFKVPEDENGLIKTVDPGFFAQMENLKELCLKSTSRSSSEQEQTLLGTGSGGGTGLDTKEHTWSIPICSQRIVCAGLACLDIELRGVSHNDAMCGNGIDESIQLFDGGISQTGGGSVSNVAKCLARLSSVVRQVIPICKVGQDANADILSKLLLPGKEHMHIIRSSTPASTTSTAVLPIYEGGQRGCFFTPGVNSSLMAGELVAVIGSLKGGDSDIGAFIFGYPHLLPGVVANNGLAKLFRAAKSDLNGCLTAMDLNGVSGPEDGLNSEIFSADILENVDLIHCNLQELFDVTQKGNLGEAADVLLTSGASAVIVTMGESGCFVKSSGGGIWGKGECRFQLPANYQVKIGDINSNGAGDHFLGGFVVASIAKKSVDGRHATLAECCAFASLVALKHIDSKTREEGKLNFESMMAEAEQLGQGC